MEILIVAGVIIGVASLVAANAVRAIWHVIPKSNDDFVCHMAAPAQQAVTLVQPARVAAPAVATLA
jgi:hypothetical protein